MTGKQSDIKSLLLHSHFFTEIAEEENVMSELMDGTVYVFCNEDVKWKTAVCKTKDAFEKCMYRNAWLLDFNCKEMPIDIKLDKNSQLSHFIENGYNLVLPLYTPDRNIKEYLVGKIDNSKNVESAASFMAVDADGIAKFCLKSALININSDLFDKRIADFSEEEYKKLECQYDDGIILNNSSKISFRGYHAPRSMSAFGEGVADAREKVKKCEISYQEGRRKLQELSGIIKKIHSEDSDKREKALEEYNVAMASMSDREAKLLLRKFIFSSKPSDVKNNVSSVTDRETMGVKSKYEIVVTEREANRKPYNFADDYQYWLFIKDQENKLHPVKMAKTSMTIYMLSLIERVTKNKKYHVVNIKNNYSAYKEVNKLLFMSGEEGSEKSFKSLDLKIGNVYEANRQGKLGECYSDIEHGLQYAFKELDEDYSPFLISREFPLAIPKEKITLPKAFLKVKIEQKM
ncbi:MAG: hypothetical protein KBT06_07860 [Prevotellaceae bacterium]|nr:hypothetical protein [Candidatus Colivivens equi]